MVDSPGDHPFHLRAVPHHPRADPHDRADQQGQEGRDGSDAGPRAASVGGRNLDQDRVEYQQGQAHQECGERPRVARNPCRARRGLGARRLYRGRQGGQPYQYHDEQYAEGETRRDHQRTPVTRTACPSDAFRSRGRIRPYIGGSRVPVPGHPRTYPADRGEGVTQTP